jgi:hypothetical protein
VTMLWEDGGYTLRLKFARFSKSLGAALVNRGLKLAPKEPLTYFL